ncbi:MAG: hypothetical protein ACM3O7_02130 [Acidobacteriota bacterium]
MKVLIVLSAVLLAAGCTSTGGTRAGASAQAQAAEDQAALAAVLKGRVAEPARQCVDLRDLGEDKPYGKGVIVFTGRTGDVLYVNRLAGSCPGLAPGRALKTRTATTLLCSGDIVTVFDPLSGTQYGGCSLGGFTPYRRASTETPKATP